MSLSDREKAMQDYPDEFDDFDTGDDDDEEYFDCGMMRDGKTHRLVGCGKAGSEECDFECPYRNEAYAEMERDSRKAGGR